MIDSERSMRQGDRETPIAEIYADYDTAYAAGDLRKALNIAHDHADLFDWSGELPDDWTEGECERAVAEGLCSR